MWELKVKIKDLDQTPIVTVSGITSESEHDVYPLYETLQPGHPCLLCLPGFYRMMTPRQPRSTTWSMCVDRRLAGLGLRVNAVLELDAWLVFVQRGLLDRGISMMACSDPITEPITKPLLMLDTHSYKATDFVGEPKSVVPLWSLSRSPHPYLLMITQGGWLIIWVANSHPVPPYTNNKSRA